MSAKVFVTGCLIALAVAASLNLMLFYGIDAEVARRDRELGRDPEGCLFESNCWSHVKHDNTLDKTSNRKEIQES